MWSCIELIKISFSNYQHVKIENSGSNIKVFVNNETTPQIDFNDHTFANGYAGLVTHKSTWSFDNLSISGGELLYQIELGPEELLYTDASLPMNRYVEIRDRKAFLVYSMIGVLVNV
ncbi:hypothetical protein [Paenibacillus nasutitermitis]|uniref:Uncharacterized protein n=1 Tax=Paenibacillus nasutitermitis TaxID=1652958 RepID=A0A916YMS6_9BACL|nr:hypothetical protein [Paenibacillus nasutitermitis]GGD52383.1 hypothetical protein GCM10010911_07380 [Paenibacillus nasutitermitis]